jgi:hypothetical protein
MSLKIMGLKILVVLVVASTLVGCSSPTPAPTAAPTTAPTQPSQPTVNVQATVIVVQTQAVQTYVANQTQNAPTATRVLPTNTLAPTAAPAVTATAQGTAVKPTATLAPKPAGPTLTPAVHCVVKSAYPTASVTISPGASFPVRWTILNTGGETWTTAYSLAYSSGARFGNQKTQNLPFSTIPNADITVAMDLTAPSTAGTYNAVWTILNGFQPVCVMGLSVIVK